MAWKSLTSTELLHHLNNPTFTALQTKALADGQTDPWAEHIENAVRLAVGFCKKQTSVGPDGTVPDEIFADVCWVAVENASTRLPIRLTEDQRKRVDRAHANLRLVAQGTIVIEPPEEPEDEVTGSPAPSLTSPTRNFSAAAQDGL